MTEGILINSVQRFQPKGIGDVKPRLVNNRGTFEFIFEAGEKGRQIAAILKDPENGFVLGQLTEHKLQVGPDEFTVEKQDVFKKGDDEGRRVGVLEVQKDKGGAIHAVFLGATNREATEIARLVRSS